MKASQIPFYAACPILYWPWLWLQFRRLDRWMADRLAQGELGEMMIHLGSRGTLTITVMSDNLRDDLPETYTTLTFESLTWVYYPEWMYTVARTLARPITIGEEGAQIFARLAECADALIADP